MMMTDDEHAYFEQLANDHHISMADLVREAVMSYGTPKIQDPDVRSLYVAAAKFERRLRESS